MFQACLNPVMGFLTHCPVWVTAETRHGKMVVRRELVVPVIVLSCKARDVVEGARGGGRRRRGGRSRRGLCSVDFPWLEGGNVSNQEKAHAWRYSRGRHGFSKRSALDALERNGFGWRFRRESGRSRNGYLAMKVQGSGESSCLLL